MEFVDQLVQLDHSSLDADTLVYSEDVDHDHTSNGLSPRLSNHESTSVSESTATESVEDMLDSECADRTLGSVPKRKRTIKKRSSEKRKRERYQTVSNNTRLELIQMVEHDGSSLKDAANHLGINYSTAKSIFAMYKKEGRILKKVNRRRFDVSPTELVQIQSQGSGSPQASPQLYGQPGTTTATTTGYQLLMGHQFPKNFSPRMCCPNCTSSLSLKQLSHESGSTRFVLVRDDSSYPVSGGAILGNNMTMDRRMVMGRRASDSAMIAARFYAQERHDPTEEYFQTSNPDDGVYLGEDRTSLVDVKQFDNDFPNCSAGFTTRLV
eukprot:CAMPEP_0115020738 /NCGR_PEP_ID=MMETSP0216-20121206/30379_1 /TAXON_ID=223996 /ORGANISM="Protocruzia adherens, Strain Boccale" /LENGTH=323 /DNA_ID=CAMNT_0002392779 /DNA_START=367 /DNA_END=1338 /DNA_ORIENTATION=-